MLLIVAGATLFAMKTYREDEKDKAEKSKTITPKKEPPKEPSLMLVHPKKPASKKHAVKRGKVKRKKVKKVTNTKKDTKKTVKTKAKKSKSAKSSK